MANSYFQFKQFIIHQDRSAMKVTTDSCLFGAWVAEEAGSQQSEAGNVLDIGTGTGLLSLMLAQKNNSLITSVEIDKDAFLQASENITVSPWKDRIKIFHADIREFSSPVLYDIIVSNSPFYENEWPSGNSKRNTAHHSSELSFEDLVAIISAMLKPKGKFYLLLPYKRNEEIMKLLDLREMTVTQNILVRQSYDHNYFRFMIEGSFEKSANTLTKEIAIKNKSNEYTKEFTALLKDYYLYM